MCQKKPATPLTNHLKGPGVGCSGFPTLLRWRAEMSVLGRSKSLNLEDLKFIIAEIEYNCELRLLPIDYQAKFKNRRVILTFGPNRPQFGIGAYS